MQRNVCKWAALVVLIIAAMAMQATAATPTNVDEIQQLVDQLDADTFSVRQAAHVKLLEIGPAAIPILDGATKSKSIEQRFRARDLIRTIRQRALYGGFERVARRRDQDIDLDEGMWLISRILNFNADREKINRQLDEMAAAVRKHLGEGVDPKTAQPKHVVNSVIHVLKNDHEFRGNVEDYHNPDNSSLARVLETRKGLPILLSHVAVSVAERLDVPIVGIGVPTRYMIKYHGEAAPKDQPKDDIIICPFGNWEILTPQQVKEKIPSFDPTEDLIPSPRRESLSRILRNLRSHLAAAQRFEELAMAERFLTLLEAGARFDH